MRERLSFGYTRKGLEKELKLHLSKKDEKLIRFAMQESEPDLMMADLESHYDYGASQALSELCFMDKDKFKETLDKGAKLRERASRENGKIQAEDAYNEFKLAPQEVNLKPKKAPKLAPYLQGIDNPPYVGQLMKTVYDYDNKMHLYQVVKVTAWFVWVKPLCDDKPSKPIRRKIQRSFNDWYIMIDLTILEPVKTAKLRKLYQD